MEKVPEMAQGSMCVFRRAGLDGGSFVCWIQSSNDFPEVLRKKSEEMKIRIANSFITGPTSDDYL